MFAPFADAREQAHGHVRVRPCNRQGRGSVLGRHHHDGRTFLTTVGGLGQCKETAALCSFRVGRANSRLRRPS